MSDISIPGVSSKYNTSKLIEDLMEVERIPLTRMEESVDEYKTQQTVWQDTARTTSKMGDSAQNLYNFQNPFEEKLAVSEDESILTATASREAVESTSKLKVVRVAQADRFISEGLANDYEVPAGDYSFAIGEEEISFSFRGGSLKRFADRINDRSKGLLRSNVVKRTAEEQVILLEGTKTGSENTIQFKDDAISFALATGMIGQSLTTERQIAVEDIPENSGINIGDNNFRLSPGQNITIPVSPEFPVNENIFLEFTLSVETASQDTIEKEQPPPGPDIPIPDSVNVEGIVIESTGSQVELPDWEPPPEPVIVEDMQILDISSRGKTISTESFEDRAGPATIRIPLSDYVASVDGLNFKNNNSLKTLQISDIRIFDPDSRGDYVPQGAIATAQDAELIYEGITINRPTNEIDDLIPGTTLFLNSESEKEIELTIEPDREQIKDAIITFVGNYNQLLTDLNILTRDNSTLIDEIEYFTDEEREKATERLGLFQGESSLSQMKTRLQTLMMNPYTTRDPENYRLLAQVGISTDSRRPGSGAYDAARLRGYLEINEDALDTALKSNILAVKDLFGKDTDGDLIVDSGAAFSINQFTQPYTRTGGIFQLKVDGLNTQIARTNDDIDDYKDYLERYESDLKRKYGMMEAALDSLEKNSQTIENFNTNNNSNR